MRLIDAEYVLKRIPPEEIISRGVIAIAPTIEPKRGELYSGQKQIADNLYKCCPDKNTFCRKTNCYINGGECNSTEHKEYSNNMTWFEYNNALGEFAEFVARWIFKPNFEEEAGAFAELACRRLNKLGYVSKEDGNWVYMSDDGGDIVKYIENDIDILNDVSNLEVK